MLSLPRTQILWTTFLFCLMPSAHTWALDTLPQDLSSDIPHCVADPPPDSMRDFSFGHLDNLVHAFAWKTFVAITWPGTVGPDSNSDSDSDEKRLIWTPAATLNAETPATDVAAPPTAEIMPKWMSWVKPSQFFLKDGSLPPLRIDLLANQKLDYTAAFQPKTNKPVWDQNGEKLYYEVRLNIDWVVEAKVAKLYSHEGQDGFPVGLIHGQCEQTDDDIDDDRFPPGYDFVGAIEVKLAWKVMGSGDVEERFYTRDAILPGRTETIKMGLVGMHISRKLISNTEWIWATFEHVDNVRDERVEDGVTITPSFRNPSCSVEDCPPNTEPRTPGPDEKYRTQITRVSSIPWNTRQANKHMQGLLKAQNSVFQHYELIGVQYNLGHGEGPSPTVLRNAVIETYFVDQEGKPNRGCMQCHRGATAADRITPSDLSFMLQFASPETPNP